MTTTPQPPFYSSEVLLRLIEVAVAVLRKVEPAGDPVNADILSSTIAVCDEALALGRTAPPAAPTGAGNELAAHALEELRQLGYTVRDGQLVPPDNLGELAQVAGWKAPR